MRLYFYIFISFMVAFFLEVMPWLSSLSFIRPIWILSILAFWILYGNEKVSYIIALILGLIWDIIVGSFLGEHSFALVIMTLILRRASLDYHNYNLFGRGLYIFILTVLFNLILFVINIFSYKAIISINMITTALSTSFLYLLVSSVLLTIDTIAANYKLGK